jgi:ribosomal protein L32
MTTTDAQIKIEINVTCPHCDEYINILDENKFPNLNEDGYLIRNALGDTFGYENFDETIQCPKCKKSFIAHEICMNKPEIQIRRAVNILEVLDYYVKIKFITSKEKEIVWGHLCDSGITNDTTIHNCLTPDYFYKEKEPELYKFAERFEKDFSVSHIIISW